MTIGSLNLIQVKKASLSQMELEEYWALLNNEMQKFTKQWEGNARDLWNSNLKICLLFKSYICTLITAMHLS